MNGKNHPGKKSTKGKRKDKYGNVNINNRKIPENSTVIAKKVHQTYDSILSSQFQGGPYYGGWITNEEINEERIPTAEDIEKILQSTLHKMSRSYQDIDNFLKIMDELPNPNKIPGFKELPSHIAEFFTHQHIAIGKVLQKLISRQLNFQDNMETEVLDVTGEVSKNLTLRNYENGIFICKGKSSSIPPKAMEVTDDIIIANDVTMMRRNGIQTMPDSARGLVIITTKKK